MKNRKYSAWINWLIVGGFAMMEVSRAEIAVREAPPPTETANPEPFQEGDGNAKQVALFHLEAVSDIISFTWVRDTILHR